MRALQRISALLAWVSLLLIGVLLVLESTDLIDGKWRGILADTANWVANPPMTRWSAALIGAGFGMIFLYMLAAQLVPQKLSTRPTIVEKSPEGTTAVGAAAQRRGVVQQLLTVAGIRDAVPISHRRSIKVQVEVADDADVSEVRHKAREAIGSEFWSGLGIDPTPVDLILVLGNSPVSSPVLHRKQETT